MRVKYGNQNYKPKVLFVPVSSDDRDFLKEDFLSTRFVSFRCTLSLDCLHLDRACSALFKHQFIIFNCNEI